MSSPSVRPTFTKLLDPLQGKVVIEEHVSDGIFNPAVTHPSSEGTTEFGFFDKAYVDDMVQRLSDVPERIRQMDACGISVMAVSLPAPGIEGIFSTDEAISTATTVNNNLHDIYQTGEHAHRFRVWACVPMQDPVAAAKEAERCVRDLGCIGVMINGYTNIGSAEDAQYLDDPRCDPFWSKINDLGVPVYIHPRNLVPSQTRIFHDYEFLAGSAWAFGRETAEHALRLMVSGLFDRYPDVQICLGHCAEGLPFAAPRLDHRIRHFKPEILKYKRDICWYLSHNFYITCAGVLRSSTLMDTIREVGEDRVLFSTDYPFEDMKEASAWFDGLELSSTMREKVGGGNARKLLRI